MSPDLVFSAQFIGGLTGLAMMAVIPNFKAKAVGLAITMAVGYSALGSVGHFHGGSSFMSNVSGKTQIQSVD